MCKDIDIDPKGLSRVCHIIVNLLSDDSVFQNNGSVHRYHDLFHENFAAV